MNLFGLLWVVAYIGSLLSPHSSFNAADCLARRSSTQALSLIHNVIKQARLNLPDCLPIPAPRPSTAPAADPISSLGWSPSQTSPHLGKGNSTQVSHSIALPLSLEGWQPVRLDLLRVEAIDRSLTATPEVGLSQAIPLFSAFDLASTSGLPLFKDAVDGKLLDPISHFIDKLLHWSKNINETLRLSPPLVTVVQVKPPHTPPDLSKLSSLSIQANSTRTKRNSQERQLEIGQSNCLPHNQLSLKRTVSEVFQVRVKGQPIAEVPTQNKADSLAQRFRQVLEAPSFDPHRLYPGMVGTLPVGKAEGELLFQIDPDLAARSEHSAELMAIAWINNLRSALNVPPLTLTEAQSQMHRLVPTAKRIKGTASWYGPYFHGRLTATGEIFDQTQLTAAHPSLPFDTYLKVTSIETGNAVIVRINDRGPYVENRSLDLSREAARCLNSEISGVVAYEAVIMKPFQVEAGR
jgi:hypothetical protein